MRETIKVEKRREAISLVTGVTYSNVIGWFGATRKELKMDILMPKHITDTEHAPCPCLIWICGGAYMSVDRSVWIPQMIRIAEAGFVVASVEYRTSNEAQFPAALIDVKSAVRYLRAHADRFCIDAERIYAAGESAGGTLASLMGVTAGHKEFEEGDYLEYSSHVSKVIDYYGLEDLTQVAPQRNDGLPKWTLDAFLGDDYSIERAAEASAVAYLDENTPPFLIFHGTGDECVPPVQSIELYQKLENLGVEADLIMIEDAYHGDDLFYQPEVLDRAIAFLKNKGTGIERDKNV